MYRFLTMLLLLIPSCLLGARITDNGQPSTADTLGGSNARDLASRILWPEYSFFQSPWRPEKIVDHGISIRIKSTAFFVNNEYDNPFATGSSLPGINFEPALEYHPDSKTTFRAGIHLLKFYGDDNFSRKAPVLSIRYDATDHFSLVFGTLSGTVNHNLILPVQDFEKYLVDNYETGLQLLWDYPGFRSDAWLNWEQFLEPGDPFQEHFTAGSNSTFMLYGSKNLWITAPVSAVFRHKGGEIDVSDLPATTRLNLVQGLRVHRTITNSFVKSVAVSQHFTEFLEINPGDQVTIPHGYGSFSRFTVDTKIGSIEAGYWKANNFVAPHGMPLFQSISRDDPDFIQAGRQMLTLRYQLELNLTDYLKFAGRIEPYYHFDTRRMDHSWSVYLIFDDGFFLSRARRK